MLHKIREALAEIGAPFHDSRVHYFKVDVSPAEESGYALTGAVLDRESYAALVDGLLERFPDLCIDGSGVQVLRSPTPVMLEVATNLASLHSAPTFQAQQTSQLLNGWPLEALLERGDWVYVRLSDGYLGWTYRPYLAGPVGLASLEPTHLVAAAISPLYDAPDRDAPLVTRLMGGTRVSVSSIEGDWAHVALAGDQAGWARGADLRALAALPFEEAAQRRLLVTDAAGLVGVPYRWGGCTACGIDCSGFTQLVYRLCGLELQRDADQQHAAGQAVGAPGGPGDLLFFREEGAGDRQITHVGLSLGGWQMIHASRARNGVYVDDIQSVPRLRSAFVAARSYL